MSCELSYRYWNPDQMGEVNHMKARLHPWHKLPQFWELASRKWKQTAWNWRLTVPKAFKVTLIRPPTTSFKMTVRADGAVSAWSPPPSTYESSCPLLISWGGELAFGQMSTLPLPPPHTLGLPASKIKQIFFSTNLDSLLAFERPAAGLHFQ